MLHHKIAQGHVKSETRHLRKSDVNLLDSYRPVLQNAMTNIILGRKIERFELKQMAKEVWQGMQESQNALWCENRPSPRSNSAHALTEHLTVATVSYAADSNIPILARSRLSFGPKRIVMEFGAAPVDISQHVLQRFLQRSEDETTAIRFIASEMDRSMGLICSMLAPGEALPEKAIAIPVGDGLVLGTVKTCSFGTRYSHQEIDQTGIHERRDEGATRPAILINSRDQDLWFVARTYIGPNEMRPSQRQLHEKLSLIADEHRDMIDLVADGCLLPSNHDTLWGKEMRHACNLLQDSVTEIFMQGRYADAMGNSAPLRERFITSLTQLEQYYDSRIAPHLDPEVPNFAGEEIEPGF